MAAPGHSGMMKPMAWAAFAELLVILLQDDYLATFSLDV